MTDTTTDTTAAKPKKKSAATTVGYAIADVARQLGIPLEVALAVGYHESGLNPTAIGDNGTSFGIYQLHEGGELGTMTRAQAFNVYKNAGRSLPIIAKVSSEHPSWTWGQKAAAAQRPADQGAYAAAVDSILTNYRQSSTDDPIGYFESLTSNIDLPATGHYTAPPGLPLGGAYGPGVTSPGVNMPPNTDPPSTDPYGLNRPKANDWITALDSAMSPKLGWNPLKDTGEVIKFVTVRGGIALVGIVFVGAGLLLMFGRDIFGAAVTAIAPEAKVAGAASGVVDSGRKAATVAKTAAEAA